MSRFGKKDTKRQPIQARPQPDDDCKAIRADIVTRFSNAFEYLAK